MALTDEHYQFHIHIFTTSDGIGGRGQNTTEGGVGDTIILERMYIRYAMAVDRIEYPVI